MCTPLLGLFLTQKSQTALAQRPQNFGARINGYFYAFAANETVMDLLLDFYDTLQTMSQNPNSNSLHAKLMPLSCSLLSFPSHSLTGSWDRLLNRLGSNASHITGMYK